MYREYFERQFFLTLEIKDKIKYYESEKERERERNLYISQSCITSSKKDYNTFFYLF